MSPSSGREDRIRIGAGLVPPTGGIELPAGERAQDLPARLAASPRPGGFRRWLARRLKAGHQVAKSPNDQGS